MFLKLWRLYSSCETDFISKNVVLNFWYHVIVLRMATLWWMLLLVLTLYYLQHLCPPRPPQRTTGRPPSLLPTHPLLGPDHSPLEPWSGFLGLMSLKGSKNKPWRHMCFSFGLGEEDRRGEEKKRHSLWPIYCDLLWLSPNQHAIYRLFPLNKRVRSADGRHGWGGGVEKPFWGKGQV